MKKRYAHCLLFVFAAFWANISSAQNLKAGPMLGKLTHNEVWLWAWGADGDSLEVLLDETNFSGQADAEGFFRIALSPLRPNTTYSYSLRLNRKDLPGEYQFRTFPDSSQFDFDMALGSCAYIMDSSVREIEGPGNIPFGKHYQVFDTIANRQPDVMFWLGDNIYLRDQGMAKPRTRFVPISSFPPATRLCTSFSDGQPHCDLG